MSTIQERQALLIRSSYRTDLLKGGGEGSRGGHIIGHTKSGKPVYKAAEGAHAHYAKFSAQDHEDAAELHREEAVKHNQSKHITRHSDHYNYYKAMQEHHSEASKVHQDAARQASRREHESKMSPDDKKIIAAAAKKQSDHHQRMVHFHNTMLEHISQYEKKHSVADGSQATIDGVQEMKHHHTQRVQHHANMRDNADNAAKGYLDRAIQNAPGFGS
jgi:hypothetical protein